MSDHGVKIVNENEVIMVDDSEGDIFLARECFDFSTVTNPWRSFTNGPAFLAYLESVRQELAPMPALVLLDLNMPGMSGLEVLERTRNDPHFEELPVFCMLTSSSDPRDRARAGALGAIGFVIKPGAFDAYVAFFDSLL
jgi:two-component system response regulator